MDTNYESLLRKPVTPEGTSTSSTRKRTIMTSAQKRGEAKVVNPEKKKLKE